jgi:hypothetical protein
MLFNSWFVNTYHQIEGLSKILFTKIKVQTKNHSNKLYRVFSKMTPVNILLFEKK